MTRLYPNVSRRRASTLLVASALTSLAPRRSCARTGDVGLGAIAERAGIVFGAAAAAELGTDPVYRRLYLEQVRSITTDYALKLDHLRPTPERRDYEQADMLVRFAAGSAVQLRGHALVWNENPPAWLKRLSAREVGRALDAHVDETVERYAGRIDVWDVVNEPFWPGHGATGGYRRGPWYDALGPAYVARALRRAAAADGRAKLVVNEAHAERSDEVGLPIRAALLRLVDELRDAGVPLHAVGLQAHLQPQHPYDDAGYADFLRQLAARDLDIHITELDVDDSSYAGEVGQRDVQSARRVHAFLTAALAVPAVNMVSTWQLSDRYSWYRSEEVVRTLKSRRPSRPLPFDDEMARKPMWDAMARAFRERRAS